MVTYKVMVIGSNQAMIYKNGHKLKLKEGDFVRVYYCGETSLGKIISKDTEFNDDKFLHILQNITKRVKI